MRERTRGEERGSGVRAAGEVVLNLGLEFLEQILLGRGGGGASGCTAPSRRERDEQAACCC
jgi:hypothetical protein